jgi:AmiR/NasT family two-component response regulator
MDNCASPENSNIAEAQGMVVAQADCTSEEALSLLNERAKATGLRLEEVAKAVVGRRTQFRHASARPPV